MTPTCRFDLRNYPNSGSVACSKVDGITGPLTAPDMRRVEAEDDAHHRSLILQALYELAAHPNDNG